VEVVPNTVAVVVVGMRQPVDHMMAGRLSLAEVEAATVEV
jgi:hypothetical protein